jgi:SnoaL-like domain
MNPETEAALEDLLAKQQIHEVIMRYCRGVDRLDPDLLRTVYHPDGYDNHGGFRGKADDFIAWVIPEMRKLYKNTNHFICNELVEVNGNFAYSESYFVAYHRFDRDGKEYDMVFGGRYIDKLERRAGDWKILKRNVLHDFNRIEPVAERYEVPINSHRSREDLCYRR